MFDFRSIFKWIQGLHLSSSWSLHIPKFFNLDSMGGWILLLFVCVCAKGSYVFNIPWFLADLTNECFFFCIFKGKFSRHKISIYISFPLKYNFIMSTSLQYYTSHYADNFSFHLSVGWISFSSGSIFLSKRAHGCFIEILLCLLQLPWYVNDILARNTIRSYFLCLWNVKMRKNVRPGCFLPLFYLNTFRLLY